MFISKLSEAERVARLEPPTGKVQMVLDTDTFNEIDDQFAVVYAMLSPEQVGLEAIYAAPFAGRHAPDGPAQGMELSYREIVNLLDLMGFPNENFVFKGSTSFLPSPDKPVPSPAVDDLVARARQPRETPLYVVAIGAITNVASALLTAPDIADKIVVVWLGGNPNYWHLATEYNVYQDMFAAHVIFDSGVPFVHVPCINVTEHLKTTLPEMERYVKGKGKIGDYLYKIFSEYYEDHFGKSKEIWDVGSVGWLVNPAWTTSHLIHSPILTTENAWGFDPSRHFIREIYSLKRDEMFGDLFRKLAKFAETNP